MTESEKAFEEFYKVGKDCPQELYERAKSSCYFIWNEAFKAAASLEREACAKVCEEMSYHGIFDFSTSQLLADAIRKRREVKS